MGLNGWLRSSILDKNILVKFIDILKKIHDN